MELEHGHGSWPQLEDALKHAQPATPASSRWSNRCGDAMCAPEHQRAAASPAALMRGLPVPAGGPALRGFFDVARCRARITVRGRWDTGLVASGSATGRGALGTTSTNARGGRVLELLAHAIELGGVIRAEPTARFG